jgi:hypothetical protein
MSSYSCIPSSTNSKEPRFAMNAVSKVKQYGRRSSGPPYSNDSQNTLSFLSSGNKASLLVRNMSSTLIVPISKGELIVCGKLVKVILQ